MTPDERPRKLSDAYRVLGKTLTAWCPDRAQRDQQARLIVADLALTGLLAGEMVNGLLFQPSEPKEIP